MTVAEYLTATGGLVTPPGVPAVSGLPTATMLGMTMRDHFAVAALNGILANMSVEEPLSKEELARCAYSAADAMLAERKRIIDPAA